MRPGCIFPIPRVGRVAPDAVKVAKGKSEKGGRQAHARTFALEGAKDFGVAVWEAGEFELGLLGWAHEMAETPNFLE